MKNAKKVGALILAISFIIGVTLPVIAGDIPGDDPITDCNEGCVNYYCTTVPCPVGDGTMGVMWYKAYQDWDVIGCDGPYVCGEVYIGCWGSDEPVGDGGRP